MRGEITKMHRDRGFGFIRGEDGLSRFFLAQKVIPQIEFDQLLEGNKVTFEPDNTGTKGNGLRAQTVRRVYGGNF